MMQPNCPTCFKIIPPERVVDTMAYCECGQSIPISKKSSHSETNQGSLPVIVFTTLLLSAVIHAINWDTYFFTIIPLKIKQLTDTASVNELKEIANICNNRKKLACEVQALSRAFELDKANESAGLLRVGQIHLDHRRFHDSARVYATYFQHGGTDEVARLNLAKSLGEIGNFNESRRHFEYLIDLSQKRNDPQFQVARAYVELLMRNNDYMSAKKIIENFRRSGPNSALFLEKEWKSINEKLKSPHFGSKNNS